MRLSVGTLRQVVKRDLPIEFVPQQLTSYGGLELLRRYVRRLELPRRLQAACAALGGDYGGARLALLVLALLVRRRPAAGASAVSGRRSARAPLLRAGPRADRAHRGQLAAALHPGDAAAAGPAQPGPGARRAGPAATAAADARCRRHRRAHRRHRRLGLSRLQSSSSEGPQLLPAARPRRADRPHPAGQESPRQRARLQASGGVPPRAHRRGPGPPGPAPAARVPHGCRVFPARCAAPARRPGLRLRHQGRLLELAAAQAAGRRAPALARRWPPA